MRLPLLYQVATAGLSPPSIAAPTRYLFRKQPNVTTQLGEVIDIDANARAVRLENGDTIAYDLLIGFHNGFVVLMDWDWAWAYVSVNRTARVVVGNEKFER